MDISDITIKPLTPQLYEDYLEFFDVRAFSDGDPNGPCYCTSPNQTEEEIKQMVGEFQACGVKETLRRYAVQMLDKDLIQGYLAFDKGISVGWCNAADIDSYTGFVPQIARELVCGKTMSIVCFEIAHEYRGMGLASAFIRRVCDDAKAMGYTAAEGYPNIDEGRKEFDYLGSIGLYRYAGFKETARRDSQVIMRKML